MPEDVGATDIIVCLYTQLSHVALTDMHLLMIVVVQVKSVVRVLPKPFCSMQETSAQVAYRFGTAIHAPLEYSAFVRRDVHEQLQTQRLRR